MIPIFFSTLSIGWGPISRGIKKKYLNFASVTFNAFSIIWWIHIVHQLERKCYLQDYGSFSYFWSGSGGSGHPFSKMKLYPQRGLLVRDYGSFQIFLLEFISLTLHAGWVHMLGSYVQNTVNSMLPESLGENVGLWSEFGIDSVVRMFQSLLLCLVVVVVALSSTCTVHVCSHMIKCTLSHIHYRKKAGKCSAENPIYKQRLLRIKSPRYEIQWETPYRSTSFRLLKSFHFGLSCCEVHQQIAFQLNNDPPEIFANI